ncbi:MAG: phosphatase [Chlorobiaceae bacterium]|nr:phosphatase [Chlorobiaceae bacterium]
MKHISCIIFDLDGTLTQTNELIFATFNHVTEKYLGKTYNPDEITKMFGPPEEIAIERLIGKERIDEAMDDFYLFYEKHHPRMANAYHGIREMLEYLKSKRLLLAIFTGKGKRSTLISLDILGIKKYFDSIITGSDVENHKPSAEGITRVMKEFELAPHQVLMVGDAVADVKAAHEAGVKIAAVLWDSYGKEKVMQMEVDYIFHNVSEFFGWLKTSLNHSENIDG